MEGSEATTEVIERRGIGERVRSIGPAALVAAAFIGPGTVTTATLSGANFGYALLWALLFSAIATIVLQEMAARLGVVTRQGLGEALRNQFSHPVAKWLSIALVVAAIGIGCGAYETGNILGGAIGLQTITGVSSIGGVRIWGPVMGVTAFILLYTGSYKMIERVLVGLVILMSVMFLTTTVIIAPDIGKVLRGIFVPTIPEGGLMTVVALIGTTVVPYNLFLHASAVQERWEDASGLASSRLDIVISIGMGALISMAVVVTSATATFFADASIEGAADMAIQLEPLLGGWAKTFMGIGLFAAGLSSAITAPLAASYATAGALGWRRTLSGKAFRAVWMAILAVGIVFSAFEFKPLSVIMFAQVANGILLPIIAIFLLWVMNNRRLLGKHVNGVWANVAGVTVVTVAIALGVRMIWKVIGA